MGDKIQAKIIAKKYGLPVIEGSEGGVSDINEAKKINAEIIPPFDHPDVINGQGTVGYEIVSDFKKNNIQAGAIIGLSGGIDSALTIALATKALGKENITAILMPSKYTSQLSLECALAQIKTLGINYKNISRKKKNSNLMNTDKQLEMKDLVIEER